MSHSGWIYRRLLRRVVQLLFLELKLLQQIGGKLKSPETQWFCHDLLSCQPYVRISSSGVDQSDIRGMRIESMVNAESSWQSSVIELAQAGNLRAIAFWINRYLVPQGICAQVLLERPGHLIVRTVCHHAPDGDRLVRFICHRLASLHSDVIQSVRITAQLVGSSQLLWMKSARLSLPVQPPQIANTMPLSPSAQSPSAQLHSAQSPGQNMAAPLAAEVRVPIASMPHRTQPHRTQPTQPHPISPKPIQFVENPRPGVAPNPAMSNPAMSNPAMPNVAMPNAMTIAAQPSRVPRKKRKIKRPLLVRWSRTTVQQVSALPQTVRQLSTQSIDWFAGQTLPVRTLTLGGSAVAVFLIGCGFELMRQYVVDPAFRESTSAAYTPRQTAGTVKAALERVPVIHADVSDPDNPAVTLLFSNSAALGKVPKDSIDSMNRASLDGANLDGAGYQPSGGIAAYRQADLIMTSLDHSLTLQQLLPSPGEDHSDPSSQASLPIPEQGATRQDAQRDDRPPTDENALEPEDSSHSAKPPAANIHELLANGIDIVNLANEQSPQAESESAELVQTIDVLNRSEIQPLGAGDSLKEARRPRIFEVKGQRIAYLGYAESPPVPTEDTAEADADTAETNAGTAETDADTAETDAADIAPELIQQVTEDIHAIRDQVDWIVVSFHWQQDLRAYPEEWQAGLTHLAIDQGADLVVGYHPQMTQGAEIYKGRAIAYSLGSSIEEIEEYEDYTDEVGDAKVGDRDTVTLKVSLQDKQMRLEFLPVQIRQGEATLATGDEATQILRHFEQASSFFDHPAQSKTVLDARLRVALPSAPDAELPTEPFLSYPETPKQE